jgi:dephospho-CoA kinase
VLKVGITGGIGSGKSVVCKIISILGISVYSADERAKFLINTNRAVQIEIKKEFGENSFSSGVYNTKYIAGLVFKNADLLFRLNEIVHPLVILDFEDWCKNHLNSKYIVHESAVLINSGVLKAIDRVIVVDAPIDLRIERLKKREGLAEQEIRNRMDKQPTVKKFNSIADWIINNDESELLIPQVLKVHQQILNLASTNG